MWFTIKFSFDSDWLDNKKNIISVIIAKVNIPEFNWNLYQTSVIKRE